MDCAVLVLYRGETRFWDLGGGVKRGKRLLSKGDTNLEGSYVDV